MLEKIIRDLCYHFPFIERKIRQREDQKFITHVFSLKEKKEIQKVFESYQRIILMLELGNLLRDILHEVGEDVQCLAESKAYSRALVFYREMNWENGKWKMENEEFENLEMREWRIED